ncbi:MAG: Ig-like domain-containing protein [Akkermansiaceae bacterium]|jgi:hypothetical protein|nr:Ig-like domain-containing protein [Akkermansiaceae bacterium]
MLFFPFRRAVLQGLLALALCSPALAVRHLIELDVQVDERIGAVTFGIEREDELGPAMQVHRRIEGSSGPSSWQWRANLPRETAEWSDSGLNPGTIYEYRFYVPADNDFPNETAAYVSCGIDAPLVDQRGRVLLVVDQTVATALSVELGRFTRDLTGDGWTVSRLDFGRHGSATPEALRAQIQSIHATTPLSSIILFGHLPVVKSGLIRPDEHEFYRQATDLFYADVDGVWQDVLETFDPEDANHFPGDGDYDHESVPGPNHRIEIPIGRIDMADMPAWPSSEVELLRRYLNKNHHFRQCRHVVPREVYFTSMAYDDSPLEAAAVVAMLGPENGVEAYDDGETEQSRPLLWGIAGRDWDGSNYPNYRFKSHFTVNFASGKQAWEWENNQMRAMLAMPWYGLTCTWGVRPNWLFHFAGMGQTLGYCNYRTVNNNNNVNTSQPLDYLPGDDFDEWLDGFVHLNLMGDPTLRIHPVPPVRALAATQASGGPVLSWQAPDDFRVIGFHVYRSSSLLGPFTRLTSGPLKSLSYKDSAAPGGASWYMVRPVKREVVPVGSYLNAGQGAFVKVQGSTVNRPPTVQNWSYTIPINGSLNFTPSMTDPDGDTVKCFIGAPPANGEITGNGPTFTYQPKAGFSGYDRFPVTAWDGLAESVGTVTVQVGFIQPPALTYTTWQAGINWLGRNSSPTADANGDGVTNAMEFHLARNPVGPRSPWYSRMETEIIEGVPWWTVEFRRRKNHPALAVKCATDGTPWWSTLVPDGRDVVMEVFPDHFPTEPLAELVRVRIRQRSEVKLRLLRLEGTD